MDKNRTEGMKHEIKGGAKELAEKATDNKGKEEAGSLEKKGGKAQHATGKQINEERKLHEKNEKHSEESRKEVKEARR